MEACSCRIQAAATRVGRCCGLSSACRRKSHERQHVTGNWSHHRYRSPSNSHRDRNTRPRNRPGFRRRPHFRPRLRTRPHSPPLTSRSCSSRRGTAGRDQPGSSRHPRRSGRPSCSPHSPVDWLRRYPPRCSRSRSRSRRPRRNSGRGAHYTSSGRARPTSQPDPGRQIPVDAYSIHSEARHGVDWLRPNLPATPRTARSSRLPAECCSDTSSGRRDCAARWREMGVEVAAVTPRQGWPGRCSGCRSACRRSPPRRRGRCHPHPRSVRRRLRLVHPSSTHRSWSR